MKENNQVTQADLEDAALLGVGEKDASLADLSAKELSILRDLHSYKSKNAIYYFTKPNPIQAELLKAWSDKSKKVFCVTGANRIGKTTSGVIISLSTLFGEFPWSKEALPFPHRMPRKVRYIGQDWEKHITQVIIPALKKWWPADRKLRTKKNNIGVESFWTDEETGSTLEIMSNKQESDLHEGWDGDLVVYDEPPHRDIRVANARGLVDRRGRELFCMTLLKESWVDREVIKAVNEDGSPDLSVFSVCGDIYTNVGFGLTEEGVEQFKKTLTDDEKEARIKGVPSYMSGLVYPAFNRKTHLRPRFEIPLDWPVDIAIDVHPRKEQAVLFIATTPNGLRYVCEEIWEHGDGKFIAEQVVRSVKRNCYRVASIIIDPFSKGDRNNDNTTYEKVDSVLRAHGLPLSTASKDKTAGILAIKNHLRGVNKEASIFFFDDLRCTIREIEGYLWDEDTQKPIDADDHFMENLYRLLLLDTKWTSLEDESEDEDAPYSREVNSVTGY